MKDQRDAEIIYKKRTIGYGTANQLVPRREADKFKFTVSKEGCMSQEYKFESKTFRGWSLVGSIIFWTGIAPPGIPLPYGVILDGAAGGMVETQCSSAGHQ